MVADLFKRDYDIMTASGVKFTPDDIIRLNALAVKVTRSATAATTVFLPRVAYLPRVSLFSPAIMLREPTIAHELWCERIGEYVNLNDNRVFRIVYLFALSHDFRDLPDPLKREKCWRKIDRFFRRAILPLTSAQVCAALDYVLFGADWTAKELAAGKYGENATDDLSSITLGLIEKTRALRLPITLKEAMSMTMSELYSVNAKAWICDGYWDSDAERKNAIAEYCRTREEIRQKSSHKDTVEKL